jgi:hypothetical protein
MWILRRPESLRTEEESRKEEVTSARWKKAVILRPFFIPVTRQGIRCLINQLPFFTTDYTEKGLISRMKEGEII